MKRHFNDFVSAVQSCIREAAYSIKYFSAPDFEKYPGEGFPVNMGQEWKNMYDIPFIDCVLVVKEYHDKSGAVGVLMDEIHSDSVTCDNLDKALTMAINIIWG